jgi:plasmid maintenance system antidote protein VapI
MKALSFFAPVTRDIASRLAVLMGMSEQFWLNMQAAADRKATV